MLLASFVVASCGGGSDEPSAASDRATVDDVVQATASSTRRGDATVLSAPDVFAAEVHVPDAALPAGVTGDRITADVLAFDNVDGDGTAGITFRLGPGGTRFREPVVLAWDGPYLADATIMLAAYEDDGQPLTDAPTGSVNSVNAVRIERTSADRAHYSLTVDHFSTWSVFLKQDDFRYDFAALRAFVTFPAELATGEPTPVRVNAIFGGGPRSGACIHAYVEATSGPLEATALTSAAACAPLGDESLAKLGADLSLRCTGAGSATIAGRLTGIAAVNPIARGSVPSSSDLRRALVRTAWELADHTVESSTTFDAPNLSGALVVKPFSGTINCVDAPPTSATSASPATPASSAETVAVASSPTAPSSETSAAPPATAPPASTKTTSSAASSLATAPPSSTSDTTALPDTTAAPDTTMDPPTTMPPDTTAPPTTAPAVWGTAGTWAHNETGTCDWNGSGGCGWYYGAQVGQYILGPMGGPGSTW